MAVPEENNEQEEVTIPSLDLGNNLLDKIKTSNSFKEESTDDEDESKDKDKDLPDDLDEDKDKEVEDKDKDKLKDKEEDDKDKNKPEDSTDEDEISIIETLKEKLGIDEIEGEFDEDLDGVSTLVSKVLEKERESFILEGQNQLLEKTPELKALKEHLDAGYKIDSFLRQQELIDWDGVKIKNEEGEIDLVLAEQIYTEARRAKGLDEDETKSLWELAKDKGEVEAKTEASIKYLKQNQEAIINKQKEAEKAQTDAIKAENDKIEAEAEKILKSGNILGIGFDSARIKRLREFAFVPDKDGRTERDKKYEALTTEQWLFIDSMVEADFKDLGVKPKATTSNTVETFKKLKQKEAERKKVPLTNTSGNGSSGKSNIDVKSLFQQKQ